MNSTQLIPAAQYVRMSTDRQEYFIANQMLAIEEYARLHGFEVVKTYADPGKSGVLIKHRAGLMQLLDDVVTGSCRYRAVLVYDVSRWGRFQDNDEAAHYEFICKQAGTPVLYCAEPFSNDCTVPSLIMKAIKRTMAGEYSRELGERVYHYQRQMVLRGFKMGARAGFGLRRKLVSADGKRDRILQDGEYKGISTDRIILVPGPARELKVVRDIYDMYLRSRGTLRAWRIAAEMNRRGIVYRTAKPQWDWHVVDRILTNPNYIGTNVWGRTSCRLDAPARSVSRSQWVEKRQAFTPIIDEKTFERAQRLRDKLKQSPTDEDLLQNLSCLLRRKGLLTRRIIDQAKSTRSLTYLRKRFGSLRRIYELTGATCRTAVFSGREKGIAAERLRDSVVKELLATFPSHLSGFRTGSRRQRPILLVDDDFTLSVVVAREYETPLGKRGWCIRPVPYEYGQLTLLCLVNSSRDRVIAMYVMPPLKMRTIQHKFDESDAWLRSGTRIDVAEFYRTALAMHARNIAEEDPSIIRRSQLLPLVHRYAKRSTFREP